MKYLEDDFPELHILAQKHQVTIDERGDKVTKICSCGKNAKMRSNLLWICPELDEIPNEYFHPG
jgi:hypothetical protein